MRHRAVPQLVAVILALTFPAPASAATMGTKFGRGVVNAATGWLELPARIGETKREGTAALWLVTSLFEGVAWGLTRTFFGIWDVISFPLPPYDGPLLDPETLITEKPPRKTAFKASARDRAACT